MSIFHKKRKRFKFTEKKHSKCGIFACVVASLCIITFVVFLVLAYKSAGTLSIYYGCAGVFVLLCSILNLFPAIRGLFEENSFQLFPRLGLFLTILSLMCWGGALLY